MRLLASPYRAALLVALPAFATLASGPTPVDGQELYFLRIVPAGGNFTLKLQQQGVVPQREGQERPGSDSRIFTEELSYGYRGSVVHERFLRFRASLGVALNQGRFRGPLGADPSDNRLLTYAVDGTFLAQHPVSLTVSTLRRNVSTMAVNLGSNRIRFERDAASMAVRNVLPATISLQLAREQRLPEVTGSGLEESRRRFDASFSLNPAGSMKRSQFRIERQSIDRPFQDLNLTNWVANTFTSFSFGRDARSPAATLLIRGDWLHQRGTDHLDRLALGSDWSMALPARMHLLVTGSHSRVKTPQDRSAITTFSSALSHRLYSSLDSRLRGTLAHTSSTRISADRARGELAVDYRKKTAIGSLNIQIGGSREREERQVSGTTGRIIREPVRLLGIDPVFLSREYVLEGSVVVRDSLGTLVYSAGIDYLVRSLGNRTTIERTLTGRIQDGDIVLVDYEYEISGSGSISRHAEGISTSMRFLFGPTLFIRRHASTHRESLLDDSRMLRATRSTTIGAHASLGSLDLRSEIENRADDVLPLKRIEADARYTHALTPVSSLVLAVRRRLIDNRKTGQGNDIWGLQVLVQAPIVRWIRSTLSLTLEDDQGFVPRRRRTQLESSSHARIGQTTISLRLWKGTDVLGNQNTRLSRVFLEMVRAF